jgi:hypothetical protein
LSPLSLRVWSGAAAALALAAPMAALAGPPYVTDDPEPTDLGHWEIYNFAEGVETPGDVPGQAGVDVNYGAAKDLQLTAVLPIDFDSVRGAGLGDIQLAAKYKILRQTDDSWLPDVSVFPRFFLPTAQRGLESDRLSVFLPVWAEKDWGRWSLFGGGGYMVNPGRGQLNGWQWGAVLTRTLNDRLTVGGEIYGNSPERVGDRPFAGVNAGADYKLAGHWSLLAAAGPGIENARRQGQFDFYLALEAQY